MSKPLAGIIQKLEAALSLCTLPQKLNVTIFEKYALHQLLAEHIRKNENNDAYAQLHLFDTTLGQR